MSPFRPGVLAPWQAHLFAAFATALSLWLRLQLDGVLGGEPTLVMLTVPIMLSAYVGGLRGGLTATALACLGAAYFLLPPLHDVRIFDPVQRWQAAFLALAGVVISLFNEALHRARRSARSHEGELDRLNRLYSALSEVNQAIVRRPSREDLFRRVCTILGEQAGFRMVWIGWSDPQSATLLPVAQWGDRSSILPMARVATDDSEHGRGPSGTAFRTGHAFVSNDVLNDPMTLPWRAALEPAGIRSCAAFPIRSGGEVAGILSVCADQVEVFRDRETSLLAEVAADVSYALDNIAQEEARRAAELALRVGEARYRKLFEDAPDGIVIADPQSTYIDANASICRMLGYRPDELIGMHATDIVAPTEHEQIGVALGELHGHAEHNRNWHFRRKDGSLFEAEVHAAELPDGNLIGMIRDVTERRKSEARIEGLNRLYALLSGINGLIVHARHREELFGDACRIAVETGGFAAAWIGRMDGGRLGVPLAAWSGIAEDYRLGIESMMRRGDAPRSAMESVIRQAQAVVVNDVAADSRVLLREEALASGIGSFVVLPLCVSTEVVALFTLCARQPGFFDAAEMRLLRNLADDISFALDHIEKSEKLDYLAYYDELTGLANRSLHLERLAQDLRGASAEGHRVALVLVDIERFKNINDSLGQAAGDELLRQVAAFLGETLGDAALVARVGGDQFAVVLPAIRQERDVAAGLEHLVGALLGREFTVHGTALRAAAKFGVAVSPDDGDDAGTLFRHAEAALKKAKAGGERFLFYTPKMTELVAGRLSLENHLRRAIEDNQFVLHYQPKLNLRSGRTSGAEALIRWNDPRGGLVSPAVFIPVLEETGLINEVGRWALRQAVADFVRWSAMGYFPVRIAVNVSALQLRNRGFIAEIEDALRLGEEASAGLELEITESMIMENIEHCISSLRAIREMGVSVAIDDFGTGFSSLGVLSKLPIDAIKIDRSFVVEMTETPEGMTLVSTIINLAHAMRLKVVAEGVETEEQSRVLRLLNCDELQGYLFSRPLPSDEFAEQFLKP